MNRVSFEETSKSEIIAALKKTHAVHVHKRLMVLKLKIVDQLTNAQGSTRQA